MSFDLLPSFDVPRGGLLTTALVLAAGCVTGRHGGWPPRIQPDLGGFDAYLVEGGAWVEGLPLFVNRDFDFSLAMADEIAGAGIAAAERTAKNRALASSLRGLRASDWAEEVRAALRSCGTSFCAAASNGAVPWALLFGQDQVRAQAVFDLGDQAAATGLRRIVVIDGEARPVDGSGEAWTANSGEAIGKAMTRAISVLPEVFDTVSPHPELGEESACPVSSTYRHSGRLLYRGSRWRAIALTGQPMTMLVCVEPTVGS